MKKIIKRKELEIGTRFLKGNTVITLVDVKKQEGIFWRSYNGTRRLYEVVPMEHVKRCPNIYKRLEA